MSDDPLLRVSNLAVGFESGGTIARAVDGVSFEVRRGRTLGIVGESGCGKSVTAFSIMRLLPQPHGRILGGSIEFEGTNLVQAGEAALHGIRGGRIGMVFQEPLSALNPVQTIGRQLGEALLLHRKMTKQQVLAESVALLGKVGIPSPEVRLGEYPHQLSGGMRQRVVIAMALSCNPSLLIADEPTTALDVTIQAQILDLMLSLQRELGMAIVLITHDLGVIAQVCDEVVVMYAGQVAEQGPVEAIFRRPTHPYTRGLLASIPRLATARKSRLPIIEGAVPGLGEMPAGCRFQNRCPHAEARCGLARPPLEAVADGHAVSCVRWRELPAFVPTGATQPGAGNREREKEVGRGRTEEPQREPAEGTGGRADRRTQEQSAGRTPILSVEDLKMHFPVKGGLWFRSLATCKAVDGVSLTLMPGETLGLVGESGCGKSTLGRSIVRLLTPTAGRILFEGADLAGLGRRQMKPIRRHLQMIFQDPAESLNARHTVGQILEEPFIIHGLGSPAERRAAVGRLVERVGLPRGAVDRYSFEFSGGQRQRIGIARALALQPRLIVCDEPVSALDVSIQSQVLNLLVDLQREFNLSYLFITHNLAVVKHVSDRIAVMYLGRIVELADADGLYAGPRHPYTRTLIAAIPEPEPPAECRAFAGTGDLPSPINPPPGCAFHPRCPHATDLCRRQAPLLRETSFGGGAPSHAVACHYDLLPAQVPSALGAVAPR